MTISGRGAVLWRHGVEEERAVRRDECIYDHPSITIVVVIDTVGVFGEGNYVGNAAKLFLKGVGLNDLIPATDSPTRSPKP